MKRRGCLDQVAMATTASNLWFAAGMLQRSAAESRRASCPALTPGINDKPRAYLDIAAMTRRSQPAVDAIFAFYGRKNRNPGAALHTLARRANLALNTEMPR